MATPAHPWRPCADRRVPRAPPVPAVTHAVRVAPACARRHIAPVPTPRPRPTLPSSAAATRPPADRARRAGLGVAHALGLLGALALLAGCRRDEPERVPATMPPAARAVDTPAAVPPPPAATGTWDGDAGLALVVPGADGQAHLVVPGIGDGASPADTAAGDPAAVLPAEVTLLGRGGLAGRARAEGMGPAAGCTGWPTVRLGPASGADALPAWTLGLARRPGATDPVPLPLDSLEGLGAGDSALVAAAVTRLAAAMPATTGRDGARLRGLPFVVRSARRFAPAPGTQAVVAVVSRALNQESAPVAEVAVLVAERTASGAGGPGSAPSAGVVPAPAGPPATGAPWRLAYADRATGPEEQVPAFEVLAALGAGTPARPALVLTREDERGTRYLLLERAAEGRWQLRWTSARAGCVN